MKKYLYFFLMIAVIFNLVFIGQSKTVYADSGQTPVYLGFKPYDSAIDPNKPVVYLTQLGGKRVYSVNYQTGEIKTLDFPYPAERIELYNDKLYVTQPKMTHDPYNFGPYSGAIAEVDTKEFKVTSVIDVDADPFDIAIDENGFIYISPGSGQWSNVKVYSIKDKEEISNLPRYTVNALSYIYYSPKVSKLYFFGTQRGTSKASLKVLNGVFQYENSSIDSFYDGRYAISKISPDGLKLYNSGGEIFELNSDDVDYDLIGKASLREAFNDCEFSLSDQLFFAAATYTKGIDVYDYKTNEYLYKIRKDLQVNKLFFQNGLVVIYSDPSGEYYLEHLSNYGPEPINFLGGTASSPTSNFLEDFNERITDIPLQGNVLTFNFDQKLKLENSDKITLKGPNGFVKIKSEVNSDCLKIVPDNLQENTTYTLSIKREALSGYQGITLPKDIVIQMNTRPTWQQIAGKWYYLSPVSGMSVKGWNNISGKMYYFDQSGVMQTGWLKLDNTWYYLQSSGAMQTGWLQSGNTWYYLQSSGAMQTGWLQAGNTWYYLQSSGAMQTGWLKLGNTWYYLQSNGAMQTGWAQIGGKWYYFYNSGVMAYSTKIGGYKLGADGAWIR